MPVELGRLYESPDKARFIADCMLGKLAKWLRMIGYDCIYIQDADDDELVGLAVRENRILLTRDKALCDRRMVKSRCIMIGWVSTSGQVIQVLRELKLDPPKEALFTRCAVCNSEIQHISRDRVLGKVPLFVYNTQQDYGHCEKCNRIYWRGSHLVHVLEALKEIERENDDA